MHSTGRRILLSLCYVGWTDRPFPDANKNHPNKPNIMIDLKRFFINPFKAREISRSELQAFSEDHLARLSGANGDGAYNAMLADTGAAHTGYFGELANVSLKLALQKAATQTMHARWAEFVKYMTGRGEARIEDRAEKPSAIHTEFYPAGLTEYHSANVADGQTLASRVKASAATHAAVLGADFKTQVDALVDGYLSAREAQMEQKGGHVDQRDNRDDAMATLQDRLFMNLLFLAGETKDPDKCAFFFNQSLLEDFASAPAPPPPVP